MDDPLIWLIIVILVIFGSFFSATETALAAANKIKLKVKADNGNRAAALAVKYIEKFETSVIATVIGSNIVSVFISSLATLFFLRVFADEGLGSLVATAVSTVLFYLFCDTIPKSMARALPNVIAQISAVILRFFIVLFFPIIFIFQGLDHLVKIVFKTPSEPEVTDDDLVTVVNEAEESGALGEEDSEIIQSAIDFAETAVKDVLTPLHKIVGINLTDLTQESLNRQLLETSFSRLPVYVNSVDNIVGVLHVRTYFKQLRNHPKLVIKDVMAKPYFVSTQILIDDLFDGFRKYKTHIAIVTDGKGKVVGMVTMEDVLEEIAGTINEMTPKRRGKGHVA